MHGRANLPCSPVRSLFHPAIKVSKGTTLVRPYCWPRFFAGLLAEILCSVVRSGLVEYRLVQLFDELVLHLNSLPAYGAESLDFADQLVLLVHCQDLV